MLCLAFGLSGASFAKVWTSEQEWSEDWELRYSQWMASDHVSPEIFSAKESPYYGIGVDCAETAYALRAIFAFENKLPFVVVEDFDKKSFITSDSDRFDAIQDPNKRFLAFAKYLTGWQGSYQLGSYDSYPIDISSVRAGDLYTYSLRTKKDGFISHVMVIKKVNTNGTFDFLYSTQKIRKNNEDYFESRDKEGKSLAPLKYKTNYAARIAPTKRTRGFRRFLWPKYLNLDPTLYPPSFAYSTKQFEVSSEEFFKMIQVAFNHNPDTADSTLARNLDQVCDLVKERIPAVQEAVDFLNTKDPNYCLSKEEYSLYSTPLRDYVIEQAFDFLQDEWLKTSAATEASHRSKIQKLVSAVFTPKARASQLGKFCPIRITESLTLDLHKIYSRIKKKQLSNNPQESLLVRWGEQSPEVVPNCSVVQAFHGPGRTLPQ